MEVERRERPSNFFEREKEKKMMIFWAYREIFVEKQG